MVQQRCWLWFARARGFGARRRGDAVWCDWLLMVGSDSRARCAHPICLRLWQPSTGLLFGIGSSPIHVSDIYLCMTRSFLSVPSLPPCLGSFTFSGRTKGPMVPFEPVFKRVQTGPRSGSNLPFRNTVDDGASRVVARRTSRRRISWRSRSDGFGSGSHPTRVAEDGEAFHGTCRIVRAERVHRSSGEASCGGTETAQSVHEQSRTAGRTVPRRSSEAEPAVPPDRGWNPGAMEATGGTCQVGVHAGQVQEGHRRIRSTTFQGGGGRPPREDMHVARQRRHDGAAEVHDARHLGGHQAGDQGQGSSPLGSHRMDGPSTVEAGPSPAGKAGGIGSQRFQPSLCAADPAIAQRSEVSGARQERELEGREPGQRHLRGGILGTGTEAGRSSRSVEAGWSHPSSSRKGELSTDIVRRNGCGNRLVVRTPPSSLARGGADERAGDAGDSRAGPSRRADGIDEAWKGPFHVGGLASTLRTSDR
eukprot:scaffold492_cov341-Pavlova_lutheri.AAC.12